MFQSPCGEMVVKVILVPATLQRVDCFSPLAGKWS